jgi:transcriptional regulator with XRE-family HTH domain
MSLKHFMVRLKEARELRAWSQTELAEKAGTHASSIAHYENGSRKPSFDAIRRLADCLEVTTDFLLGRVDHPGLLGGDSVLAELGALTGEDRELAKDFLKLLAARRASQTR